MRLGSRFFAVFLEQHLGPKPRRCHKHLLAARAHTADDCYLTPLHPQAPGEKFDQAFIGFPVHRGRSHAHLDAIVVQASDLGALGSGLGMDMNGDTIAAGLVPAQSSSATARVTYSSGISSSCAATKANSGDRSTLPMGATIRRNGRKIGAVSALNSGASGAFGLTQLITA